MTCCSSCSNTTGTNDFFNSQSKRYLKQYRKKGLAKEQRLLEAGITGSGIQNKSILEVGCGIGALHLTLMKNGAEKSTGIDISEGMITTAKQLAGEFGFAERTTYHLGDIVQMNGNIPEADIVILDKVVCCYKNVFDLLKVSSEKCRQTYAFSYPNPNILVQISFKGLILIGKLLKWKFYPSWHDWSGLIRTLETYGFKQSYQNSTFMWNVCVLERK